MRTDGGRAGGRDGAMAREREGARAREREGGMRGEREGGSRLALNDPLTAQRSPLTSSRSPLTRLIAALRTILGMPNYAAYCEHQRTAHPDRVPLSEGDFFTQYVRSRYEGGPTRCC